MRRLPIYFLIDVSESMIEHLSKIDAGIQLLIRELTRNPYALETAFVSTIVFAGRTVVLNPLTEVLSLSVPKLPLGSGTNYSSVFKTLMQQIDSEVIHSTETVKGDWKPLVFMFTDGNPTDMYQSVFKRWNSHYRTKTSFVVFSLAPNLDFSILGQITDQIFLIESLDRNSLNKFFNWISSSIQSTSIALGKSNIVLEPLDNVKVRKINLKKDPYNYISNDIVKYLTGKCSNRLARYLARFEKNEKNGEFKDTGIFIVPDDSMYDMLSEQNANSNSFDISKIDSSSLHSKCPFCGNDSFLIKCSCGKLFCADTSTPVYKDLAIVMALDVSASMTGLPMEQSKQAMINFVNDLKKYPGKVEIGVIAVSNRSEIVQDLTTNFSKCISRINEMWVGMTGNANLSSPFKDIRYMLSNRIESKKIAIVLADGGWTRQDYAIRMANACHNDGIDIIGMGFGEADELFLKAISSGSISAMKFELSELEFSLGKISKQISLDAGCSKGAKLTCPWCNKIGYYTTGNYSVSSGLG